MRFLICHYFPGNRSGVKLKLCQDPKRLSADDPFSLPGITGSFAPSQRFYNCSSNDLQDKFFFLHQTILHSSGFFADCQVLY